MVYLRGLAYLRTRESARRPASFKRSSITRARTGARATRCAYLGLARAAAQAGDRPGSQEGVSGLPDAVERRGRGHPLLIEAKKEYAALR